MKRFTFFFLLVFFFTQIANAQSTYRYFYRIKNDIKYKVRYIDANQNVKDSTVMLDLQRTNGKINIALTNKVNTEKGLRADVAFENEQSDKILVNPWLIVDENRVYVDRDTVYYYELQNRQSVKIDFRHWSLNVLTVPLKVRFGDGKQQYLSGANLGGLVGYTWGKTNFLHRKRIGNKQFDTKQTLGGFLGADKLEYSFTNNDTKEIKVQTAVVSTGIGYAFSYEGFTFGLTAGFDFALGENSSEWSYQGSPWLGAGIGYSLFKF